MPTDDSNDSTVFFIGVGFIVAAIALGIHDLTVTLWPLSATAVSQLTLPAIIAATGVVLIGLSVVLSYLEKIYFVVWDVKSKQQK